MQAQQDVSSKTVARFILGQIKPFPAGILCMVFVAIVWAIDLSLRPYILKIIIDRVATVPYAAVMEAVAMPAIVYFLMIVIYPTIFRFYGYLIEVRMIPNLR